VSAASATPLRLYKMRYFREGGSERHLRDIAGMLRISSAEIDIQYVTEWSERLSLSDIWNSVLHQIRGE